ncbi:MAG: hypothetical protein M1816_005409 [Peltula sp. TS41687]|nr:MAG: hypothetical protein M1816_005409 [Peltula sp. TS41687]
MRPFLCQYCMDYCVSGTKPPLPDGSTSPPRRPPQLPFNGKHVDPTQPPTTVHSLPNKPQRRQLSQLLRLRRAHVSGLRDLRWARAQGMTDTATGALVRKFLDSIPTILERYGGVFPYGCHEEYRRRGPFPPKPRDPGEPGRKLPQDREWELTREFYDRVRELGLDGRPNRKTPGKTSVVAERGRGRGREKDLVTGAQRPQQQQQHGRGGVGQSQDQGQDSPEAAFIAGTIRCVVGQLQQLLRIGGAGGDVQRTLGSTCAHQVLSRWAEGYSRLSTQLGQTYRQSGLAGQKRLLSDHLTAVLDSNANAAEAVGTVGRLLHRVPITIFFCVVGEYGAQSEVVDSEEDR